MEDNTIKNLPTKGGWYWVLIDGYDYGIPCLYVHSDNISDCYFLPAGLGDRSSSGIFLNEEDGVLEVSDEIPNPFIQ